jgi:hypothetical protein
MTGQDQTDWENQLGQTPAMTAAQAETAAQGFSETLLDQDIQTKAGRDDWNNNSLSTSVNVPLYQSQFDAVVDYKFNRNPNALNDKSGRTAANSLVQHQDGMLALLTGGDIMRLAQS